MFTMDFIPATILPVLVLVLVVLVLVALAIVVLPIHHLCWLPATIDTSKSINRNHLIFHILTTRTVIGLCILISRIDDP
jgi:hypothetical protein